MLVFVIVDGSVLLIHKKRGLGAGKINAPGGRLEVGESAMAAGVREVQEELRITPTGLEWCGVNRFQFVDGYSIHVDVFRADGFEGDPEETDEAIPLWTPVDQIPYDDMWQDDRLWLPHVLERTPFSGHFVFEEDVMLDHSVERIPRPPQEVVGS